MFLNEWKVKMIKLRKILLVSATALALGQAANATYTQLQLDQIRLLIDAGDALALAAYITANPELLDGDDPLAVALRDFVETQDGAISFIEGTPLPDLLDVPNLPDDVESSDDIEDFGSLSDFGS